MSDRAAWHLALSNGSFEDAYAALEGVVAALESGGLPLADSIDLYELGVLLSARCGGILDAAELRVSTLERAAVVAPEDDLFADDTDKMDDLDSSPF